MTKRFPGLVLFFIFYDFRWNVRKVLCREEETLFCLIKTHLGCNKVDGRRFCENEVVLCEALIQRFAGSV